MLGGLRGVSALGAVLAAAWVGACDSPDSADSPTPGEECGKVVLDGGGGIVMPDDGSKAPECMPSDCNFQTHDGCPATRSCMPSVLEGNVVSGCFEAGT